MVAVTLLAASVAIATKTSFTVDIWATNSIKSTDPVFANTKATVS